MVVPLSCTDSICPAGQGLHARAWTSVCWKLTRRDMSDIWRQASISPTMFDSTVCYPIIVHHARITIEYVANRQYKQAIEHVVCLSPPTLWMILYHEIHSSDFPPLSPTEWPECCRAPLWQIWQKQPSTFLFICSFSLEQIQGSHCMPVATFGTLTQCIFFTGYKSCIDPSIFYSFFFNFKLSYGTPITFNFIK